MSNVNGQGGGCSKAVSPQRMATEIVKKMKEDGGEQFESSNGDPMVILPGDNSRREWLCNSQRVQDWVAMEYYSRTLNMIDKITLYFTLLFLREECRVGVCRPSESEMDENENHPIVQGMQLVVNITPRFEGRTADLQDRLLKEQDNGNISRKEEIPQLTNQFSRQLKNLIPELKELGIDIKIEHRESGSYVKIRRLKNFAVEPSDGKQRFPDGGKTASSDPTPTVTKTLAEADDTDAHYEYEPDEPEDSSLLGLIGADHPAQQSPPTSVDVDANSQKGGVK